MADRFEKSGEALMRNFSGGFDAAGADRGVEDPADADRQAGEALQIIHREMRRLTAAIHARFPHMHVVAVVGAGVKSSDGFRIAQAGTTCTTATRYESMFAAAKQRITEERARLDAHLASLAEPRH